MLILPVSAIVATANRALVLKQMIDSLLSQDCLPQQLIFIDASEDYESRGIIDLIKVPGIEVIYETANYKGAAAQRNQGVKRALQPCIAFFDDDIVFEPGCVRLLFHAISNNNFVGGVNAMVLNQQYHTPGRVTRFMYRLMSGVSLPSYAGKCIGPAWNLLPEDRPDLPLINKMEWLNTTFVIYRKHALPDPPFTDHFTGYSLLEDLALSLTVAKKWELYNVRNARIFHNSQPGSHKNNQRSIAKMELVNRHYIMTKVMNRKSVIHHLQLLMFELFGLMSSSQTRFSFSTWRGKFDAVITIFSKR